MKTKKISNPFRKGNAYAQRKFCGLYLSLCLIVLAASAIAMCLDPNFLPEGVSIFSGTSLASMMIIGSVDDVSDRLTTGSNISYQVYLIEVSQVNRSVQFPKPNANRQVGSIPMATGQYMQYFEAHDIPTFTATGEKGDITTTGENVFTVIMGGMRDKCLDFIEQHAGSKFIILFKEVGSSEWNILGDIDRPMVLSSYESKNDKDGRYITFTFKRSSINQYYHYVGNIATAPTAAHTAGSTTLAISPSGNEYTIPNGTAATYAINAVSGLTANDKGRHITLIGAGTTNAATIADSTAFILEDGSTWTARSGSSITFLVLDTTTLVEVSGTRIQTA